MVEVPLLNDERPMEALSDDEVMALAEIRFTSEQDDEFSDLLYLNREGGLDEKGRERLDEYMEVYKKGMLRKAEALRAAVERGLREPLSF